MSKPIPTILEIIDGLPDAQDFDWVEKQNIQVGWSCPAHEKYGARAHVNYINREKGVYCCDGRGVHRAK